MFDSVKAVMTELLIQQGEEALAEAIWTPWYSRLNRAMSAMTSLDGELRSLLDSLNDSAPILKSSTALRHIEVHLKLMAVDMACFCEQTLCFVAALYEVPGTFGFRQYPELLCHPQIQASPVAALFARYGDLIPTNRISLNRDWVVSRGNLFDWDVGILDDPDPGGIFADESGIDSPEAREYETWRRQITPQSVIFDHSDAYSAWLGHLECLTDELSQLAAPLVRKRFLGTADDTGAATA